MRELVRLHVRPYTGLVVMKLVVTASVEHAVYLKDVRVRIRSGELVSCAIEAKNELPTLPSRRHCWMRSIVWAWTGSSLATVLIAESVRLQTGHDYSASKRDAGTPRRGTSGKDDNSSTKLVNCTVKGPTNGNHRQYQYRDHILTGSGESQCRIDVIRW